MKLKRILCMLAVLVALSTAVICTASAAGDAAKKEVAENETEMLEPSAAVSAGNSKDIPLAEPAAEKTDKKDVVLDDAVEKLGLKNPCVVDENGNVALSSDELIDLVLPKVLGGKALTSISAKSFAGCPYIRSVVVPETILEIGEGAFANCEFLETIYVIGHSEEDLTLGSNWNGNAEVVFVVDEVEEEEAPVEDEDATAEEQKAEDADKEDAPAESQPSDEGEVKAANTSEAADSAKENDGAVEKAPAEENDSDDQEKADAQQPDDDEEKSVPSGDAGEEAPQSNESVSAEGNDGAAAPAESSGATEA